MTKRLLLSAFGAAAVLAFVAAPAMAADTGYNAPPTASVEGQCHGTFGAFDHNFTYSKFVPSADAHLDMGQHGGGSATNPNAEPGSCG